MQPDTSRQVTSLSPLAALTSYRISAPVQSHRVRKTGRPDLNFPMAETTRVALSNIPSVLLAVMLLAALISCGPVPSEEGSRNRVSDSGTGPARGLSPAETVPHRGLEPVPQAWPASRASNMQSLPTARDQPTRMPEQLVLPESIAKELTSPDVSVRLRALDTLAQQGPKAPLDHLVVALDDEDEAVRDKALAIIEQQAAIEPEWEEVSSEQ